MELNIVSKKHGVFVAYFDKEDESTVSRHTWCVSRKKSISNKFYAATSINNKIVYMHHMIFGKIGVSTNNHIDHIDGNSLNNRRSNLRLITVSQNIANSGVRKNNSTGYKGVTKKRNKYSVKIKVNRVVINGGVFDTKKDAAIKYNELAVKYFGHYAWLNKID